MLAGRTCEHPLCAHDLMGHLMVNTQMGDEVVYLREGHELYLTNIGVRVIVLPLYSCTAMQRYSGCSNTAQKDSD